MSWLADYAIALLQRKPLWVRLIVGLARNINPIISLGGTHFVLRADDVSSVLERPEDFEIGEPNGPKMLQGPFILGMDTIWDRYWLDRKEMAKVLGDLAAQHTEVLEAACDDALGEIDGKDKVELVSQFAEPVMTALLNKFYGIPEPEPSELLTELSAQSRLIRVVRATGSVIAFRSPAPFGRDRFAKRASKELAGHLNALIKDRQRAIEQSEREMAATVVDRLVANEVCRVAEQRARGNDIVFDVDIVRAKLAGLVLAGTIALIKAFCHSIDQLLRGKMGGSGRKPLKLAIEAAKAGDVDRVKRLALEALRFNPTFPLISRYCPYATSLGAGGSDPTELRPGTVVVPALISAMFDEAAQPQPENFGPQRPPEFHYHFGRGQHRCLGEAVATEALTAMAMRLLQIQRLDQFRAGKLIYDGVAIDRYVIRLGKPRES